MAQTGLLAQAIADFLQKFLPAHFTDEKVMDSPIWGWIRACRKGSIISGTVQYR